MAVLTQRRYGLSGRRYGSFSGKTVSTPEVPTDAVYNVTMRLRRAYGLDMDGRDYTLKLARSYTIEVVNDG